MFIEPEPRALPFLIVHGALIWKGALAALVLAALAIREMLRRRVGRRGPASLLQRILLAAAVAAGTALIGWGAGVGLGKRWLTACEQLGPQPLAERALTLKSSHACVLAAAAPGARWPALWHLQRTLERDPYRDGATLRRLVAMTSLLGGCHSVTRQLLEHGRYEDAGVQARRCGSGRDEYVALVLQGRFAEAAAVRRPPQAREPAGVDGADGAVLIAAGQFAAAAVASEARAAQSQGGTANAYRCLAELLRHHGGDPAAALRMRAPVGPRGMPACAGMLAELSPAQSAYQEEDWPFGIFGLGLESWSAPEIVLARPDLESELMSSARWLWGASWELKALPAASPPYRRALVWRWLAAAQVLDGDLDAATASLRAAEAQARPEPWLTGSRFVPRSRPPLSTILQLYTPATTLPLEIEKVPELRSVFLSERESWQSTYGRLLLRCGHPLDASYFLSNEQRAAAFRAAQGGDGWPLVQQLHAESAAPVQDGDVLAVLPHVHRGRDALVRQLIWSAPHRPFTDRMDGLWGLGVRAAVRRDTLRVAGAAAEAARWDAIYRRFAEVFYDRRRHVPLGIWLRLGQRARE